MAKPRKPRAADADPVARLFYAGMALEALRLTRLYAAGIAPTPGEVQWLDSTPPAVRDAVLAQWKPNSRYLPIAVRRLDAAEGEARVRYRARVLAVQRAAIAADPHGTAPLPVPARTERAALEEWSAAQARWHRDTEGKDQPHRAGRPSRVATIELPAQTPGTAGILEAIAKDAGVTTHTIRTWASTQRTALDAADAEDAAASLREAGYVVAEPDPQPTKRRYKPGYRASGR